LNQIAQDFDLALQKQFLDPQKFDRDLI